MRRWNSGTWGLLPLAVNQILIRAAASPVIGWRRTIAEETPQTFDSQAHAGRVPDRPDPEGQVTGIGAAQAGFRAAVSLSFIGHLNVGSRNTVARKQRVFDPLLCVRTH